MNKILKQPKKRFLNANIWAYCFLTEVILMALIINIYIHIQNKSILLITVCVQICETLLKKTFGFYIFFQTCLWPFLLKNVFQKIRCLYFIFFICMKLHLQIAKTIYIYVTIPRLFKINRTFFNTPPPPSPPSVFIDF